MKKQIIKIIESKAQGKYHLEIDESDLEVIANEILNLFDVSKQSELLKAFVDFYNYRNTGDKTIYNDEIEIFIDSL